MQYGGGGGGGGGEITNIKWCYVVWGYYHILEATGYRTFQGSALTCMYMYIYTETGLQAHMAVTMHCIGRVNTESLWQCI